MAIPDFQSLMRPLLELAADGREHSLQEAREKLTMKFGLTEAEQQALLPSGRQPVFANRVAWAKVYLQRAGILDALQRGTFKISDRGRDALKQAPDRITSKYLDRYPEFVEFRSTPKKEKEIRAVTSEDDGQTPEETLETAHHKLRANLASELLARESVLASFFRASRYRATVEDGLWRLQKRSG